jgi:hypothetical protein
MQPTRSHGIARTRRNRTTAGIPGISLNPMQCVFDAFRARTAVLPVFPPTGRFRFPTLTVSGTDCRPTRLCKVPAAGETDVDWHRLEMVAFCATTAVSDRQKMAESAMNMADTNRTRRNSRVPACVAVDILKRQTLVVWYVAVTCSVLRLRTFWSMMTMSRRWTRY